MNWAVVTPIVVAALAPVGAYFVAARRMRGQIAESNSKELWTESRSIRDDYRDRISSSDKRVLALESRVAKLEGDNNDLVRENLMLRAKVDALEALVASLRETITRLEGELKEARQ